MRIVLLCFATVHSLGALFTESVNDKPPEQQDEGATQTSKAESPDGVVYERSTGWNFNMSSMIVPKSGHTHADESQARRGKADKPEPHFEMRHALF